MPIQHIKCVQPLMIPPSPIPMSYSMLLRDHRISAPLVASMLSGFTAPFILVTLSNRTHALDRDTSQTHVGILFAMTACGQLIAAAASVAMSWRQARDTRWRIIAGSALLSVSAFVLAAASSYYIV